MSCAGQYFWPGDSLLPYLKNYSTDYENYYIYRNNKQFWICQWSLLYSCEYFLRRKVAKEKSSFEKMKALNTNRRLPSEKKDLKIFHFSFMYFNIFLPILNSRNRHCRKFQINNIYRRRKKCFLLWKFVLFPASFWPAYDWKNRIWPIKLERTDACESSDMSFFRKFKFIS